jgi:pimeloyl-ACP methyl ester carboxylesterase
LAFVLVHGAWGGSWMWSRVARLLRAAGRDVYTPSLTGIGERTHLASPDIGLSTHVHDVLGVFTYERLSDVVLVGHSYGGMVITAVADRVPEKIRALVYLDAFVPKDGEAVLDIVRPEMRDAILAIKGSEIPAFPPQRQGMKDPEEIAWLEGRRSAQPLKTFTEPVVLKNRAFPKRSYIFCAGYSPTTFAGFAEEKRKDKEWRYHELPTHHYPQVSMPRETAALLLQY